MTLDPAKLRIVHHPHPMLRERAAELPEITDHVRAVAERMVELMHQADGIGLAAPQVALPWRLFVCHVPPAPEGADNTDPLAGPLTANDAPVVFINPQITERARTVQALEEGCLSLPEIRGEVRRPARIRVRALDAQGRPFAIHAQGLLARCIQHEHDHLDGVLIIDKFTRADREKNQSAIDQLEAGVA